MYHNYKHKGGGYFKGRSKSGKFYTSKYPPFPKANFGNSNNKKPWLLIVLMIAWLLLILLFIIT